MNPESMAWNDASDVVAGAGWTRYEICLLIELLDSVVFAWEPGRALAPELQDEMRSADEDVLDCLMDRWGVTHTRWNELVRSLDDNEQLTAAVIRMTGTY